MPTTSDPTLDKALDKILAHIGTEEYDLSKAVDDLADDLEATEKDHAVRFARVEEEMDELRTVLEELQEVYQDHETRVDGLARDMWPLVKKDRQSRQTEGQREGAPDRLEEALEDTDGEGTRKVKQLIKSICPQADQAGAARLAAILKSWFGPNGGQVVRYDRELAAHLLLTKAATREELARWQGTNRLPDWVTLGKAWAPDPHEVSSLKYKWYQPGQESSAQEEVSATVQQEQRRSQVARMLAKGWSPQYDADLASRLTLAKAISPAEAHGWHQSGVLKLYTSAANVSVQQPVGPAVAALLLPGSVLGRSAVRKPGYGHSTVRR